MHMLEKNLFEKISASFFVALFLFFSLSSSILMASPAHASTMPMPTKSAQDHSTHVAHASEEGASNTQTQQHAVAIASHTTNACAALCQTSTTTKPSVSLPSSEKEEDDEIFDDDTTSKSECPPAINDPAPVYQERSLKVPLYLRHCLLRL